MAGLRPNLHGARIGAEQLRYLVEREQTPTPKAAVAVLESVCASQRVEDLEAEAFGHSGAEPVRVEDVDDLGVGVVVEQAVDFGDHGRIDLAQLSCVEWQGQMKAVGGATSKADQGDDLVSAQQGDVFQQEPDHALALTLRHGRIAPEAGEVGGHGIGAGRPGHPVPAHSFNPKRLGRPA